MWEQVSFTGAGRGGEGNMGEEKDNFHIFCNLEQGFGMKKVHMISVTMKIHSFFDDKVDS